VYGHENRKKKILVELEMNSEFVVESIDPNPNCHCTVLEKKLQNPYKKNRKMIKK